MVIIKFYFVLLLTIFHVSHCQRRIINGEEVTADKSYVVYLVKAGLSDKRYDSWVCGGALVTKEFIITSAACVEDVQFMYAIAGYRKYVPDKDLNNDMCTSKMKKKIVYTCVPISYQFDFDEIEKWAYIDIALVKVESPYELNSPDYQLMCSYAPTIIPINYDLKRQAADIDAIVLGWGHTEIWRTVNDKKNYNQEYLRFGATTLYDKNLCKEAYKDYPNFVSTIEKYMICSLNPGHLNDHGIPYIMNQNKHGSRTGCITQKQQSLGLRGALCKEDIVKNQAKQVKVQARDARKHMSLKEKSNDATNKDNGTNTVNGTNISNRTNSANETDYIYKPGFGKIRGYFNRSFTRRNGICQNDHGGPLVTWVGKREVLIGIASVFRITENNTCIGPFLYTSTVCNGAFIGCVIGDRKANVLRGQNESVSPRKALLCDSDPSVKGFDTIESYVSWKHHPDGPADNERPTEQEQQRKGHHYATILQQDSDGNPLKEKEEPKDRFSLKIGLPPKRTRLRKRPPVKQRPSVQQRPPAQQWLPAQQWPPAQQRLPVQKWPLVQQRLPEQKWPLVQQRLQFQQRPLERNIRPLRNRPPSEQDPQLLNGSLGMESQVLKRPPPKIKPPPVYALPPEMKPPPVYAPPPEIEPSPEINPQPVFTPPPETKPPQISPSLEITPLSEITLPPEIDPASLLRSPPENEPPTKNRPPPAIAPLSKMEAPEFDEMVDFKSDEKIMEKKPIYVKTETASSYVRAQPEILMRPQSPLNG